MKRQLLGSPLVINRLAKRLKQLFCRHGVERSTLIERNRNGHPRDDEEWVYTENIWRCQCGKVWKDRGFELRTDTSDWLKQGGLNSDH